MKTSTQGPLIATERVTLPGTGTYVELSQTRSTNGIHYSIEHGSVRWGHRGTWGRDNAQAASKCFASAVAFQARTGE